MKRLKELISEGWDRLLLILIMGLLRLSGKEYWDEWEDNLEP